MAAALPAIITAVKVVGTVMSVVSMIKGIKDGNFLQAVVGGFGAFMGASSLAAGSASSASNATGAVASDAAAGTSIMGDTSTAAMFGPAGPGGASASTANLIEGAGSQGLLQMGGATNNILGEGLAAGNNMLAGSAGDNGIKGSANDRIIGAPESPNGEAGFFDQIGSGVKDIGSALKENPELAKYGFGLLQGYSQGAAAEDERDFLKKRLDEKRARVGKTFIPTVNPFAAR